MVDFQQRDTSRGLGDDEDGEDDETEATDEPMGDDPIEDEQDTDEESIEKDHSHEDHGHEHGDHGEDDHGGHDHDDHDAHGHDHGHDDHGHGHHAHDLDSLGVAVVTVSSTRTRDDDPSGDVIESRAEAGGHAVVARDVVRDSFDGVQGAVDNLVGRDDVDIVVTTGGTGVTPDDVTVEAVEPLFEKELPGFGELFRLLSHDEIGTKVVGTRAVAGIVDGVPVFCLPGSENAARLGIEEIILEEGPHLAGLATRE